MLAEYPDDLPRSILLFVGNVRAAEANRRFPARPGRLQPLLARHPNPARPRSMMQRIVEIAQHGLPLFAAIDIHNNTGKNPHYACITDPTLENQNLAARFNRVGDGVQSPWVSPPWRSTASARRSRSNAACPATRRHSRISLRRRTTDLDELPDQSRRRDELHLVESHLSLNIPSMSASPDLRPMPTCASCRTSRIATFTLFDPHQVFGYTRVARPL